MSRFDHSLPASYFDDLYAKDPDPWRFAASAYEREKYAATLAALPQARYRDVFEVGCSIGVLTAALAPRCDALLAVDLAAAALEQARQRCADLDHVRFAQMAVPGDWPDGRFDLILLSEVVYYLDRQDVSRLASRVAESLQPGGDVVLVHWLGETHYPLSGDEAADLFISAPLTASTDWTVLRQERTPDYRLDVLRVREVPARE
jgi:SAM-dependent methyltransferase